MTTTFDALLRLLKHYRTKMREEDYQILRWTIEAIHTLQHRENSHRIDNYIEQYLTPFKQRFRYWKEASEK